MEDVEGAVGCVGLHGGMCACVLGTGCWVHFWGRRSAASPPGAAELSPHEETRRVFLGTEVLI